eukprot:gene7873-7703_t
MKSNLPRKQKGAVAIEFALVFVIFFAVLYAIVTYSLPLLLMQSFNQSTAEAVRRSVALDPNMPGYEAALKNVVKLELTRQLAWIPAGLNFDVTTDTTTTYTGGVLKVAIHYPSQKLNAFEPAILSAGDKLFGRLLNRHPPAHQEIVEPPSVLSVGLQIQLDAQGRVLHLSGPLRHLLAQQAPAAQLVHLLDFLLPHCSLAIEGPPADWRGQLLDLDFYSLSGSPLHLRGWVQPMADTWLLQLLDIGDLLLERRQARLREQCQLLAAQIGEQLRLCSLTRLPDVLVDQLQSLAQRFHIPCIALALLDEQEGWQIHQHYAGFDTPSLWHNGQRLGTGLDSLDGS